MFVDESKSGNYRLIASVVASHDLVVARKAIRALVLPGQRRLHMKSEGDGRRRVILTELEHHGFKATIYRAGTPFKTDLDRRRHGLDRLVADIAKAGHTMLCLESDETLDARDRRDLAAFTRTHGCAETLRYQHQRAAQEALLAVPDAVGWAYARGGDWRRRAQPLIQEVIDL
ncbi:hypothetical protein ACFWH7_03700 [Cellulosimicrobium cellulans]|uniref:hypothetical protein n=1 Tax=Cellulosimicrobium cellulans TaxID=1710 RepID=UPI003646A869